MLAVEHIEEAIRHGREHNAVRVQLSALMTFVRTNKQRMDEQLKCIAIIVANPLVRKLLNFFIWMFRPAQPVRMMASLEEGFAFLRENVPDGTAVAPDTTESETETGGAPATAPPPGSTS